MKFAYRAVDEAGTPASGELIAAGVLEATEKLREQGLTTVTLTPSEPQPAPTSGGVDEFVFFNQSLAEMTRTGLPLVASIRHIAGGVRKGSFKAKLERIEAALRDGRPLDEALSDFPESYRWLVRAGLRAGRVSAVLSAIAVHAQVVQRIKRGIAKAVVYPIALLIGGLVMGSYLVSELRPVYELAHAQLLLDSPAPASLAPLYVVTGGILAAVVLFAAVLLFGREKLRWKIPLAGPLLKSLALERFYASLQILIESGVPLAEAVPVAAMASGSRQFAESAPQWQRDLAQGAPLGSVLKIPLLSDAERKGALAERLGELRSRTVEDSEGRCDHLLMALEPAATLTVGILILTLCLILSQPYIELVRQLTER